MNWRIFRLFWVFFLISASWVHAETYVSGPITSDTTWTEAESPYIASSISVASGATLTLEQGVIVKMNGGSIDVSGTIIANGTADKKIYFTSFTDDTPGGWGGINVWRGGRVILDNTVVRYAGYTGIYINYGEVSISNSDISHQQTYGIFNLGGRLSLLQSNIHDNNSYGVFGFGAGSVSFTNNNFVRNYFPAYIDIGGGMDFSHDSNTASGNYINAFGIVGATQKDYIWTADNIPYYVAGVTVSAGNKLTIGEGSIIKSPSLTILGALDVLGTSEKPVYFTSVKDDTVGGDTNNDGAASTPQSADTSTIYIRPGGAANFNHANLFYGGAQGIVRTEGETNIIDSSFSGGYYGVLVESGTTTISHTDIARNNFGLYFNGVSLTISQSSIHGNNYYGAYNAAAEIFHNNLIIDARSNWWGSPSGPYHPTLNPAGNVGSSVSNNVDFVPWLGEDPLVAPPPTPTPTPLPTCCSNVLFLPGLEASRLYLEDGKQIWNPLLDHDNSRLFLNPDGSSILPNIYTKNIIDEVYGSNIYKSFMREMDNLVSSHAINQWQAYPYDWRFDVNDIVNNPTRVEEGLASLVPYLEDLATASQTGKVTIISHSNGGLIGKILINKLVADGKADLVDKFIMVASPQLGTPKAISALLHGEGMPGILPFMMLAQTSRTLAENMPSAYTLLPSNEYFARVLDPVVEFDPIPPITDPSASLISPYINKYGVAITNSVELKSFLLGEEGRAKPVSSDTMTPNILNSTLLAQGIGDHVALDSWQSPPGIETIQIVGWGIPTIREIKYSEKIKPFCLFNCLFLDHEPIMTSDGDETVVVPSVNASNEETHYLNLKALNKDESFFGLNFSSKNHGSILEAQPLLSFVKGIIQESSTTSRYITSSQPNFDPTSDPPSLRLKVHSPVSLDIYDASGRHTGISTFTPFYPDHLIDEQIPNSYYLEMGEGKYAGADILGTTTVKLIGQDFGVFTLDIEKLNGDTLIASTTFKDIPVAAGAVATFAVSANNSTTLNVDENGDGLIDASITPGDGLTTEELIGILIGFIKTLHLPETTETQLLKKVDKLAKTLNTDYYKKQKTSAAFSNLSKAIDSYVKKGLLTTTEAADLKNLLGKIQGAVVE